MEKTYKVQTRDDFERCDDCVHSGDSLEVCKKRMCAHAIPENAIKECYEPKVPQKKDGWISIKEDLPKEDGDYIVTMIQELFDGTKKKLVRLDHYSTKYKEFGLDGETVIMCGNTGKVRVLAWLPFPNPYEGE